jgi:hypothetical protein
MRHLFACLLLVPFAGFVGCERGPDTEPALMPAAGTTPAAQSAIENIAAARCNTEQSCNRVGPARKYASYDHCLSVMRSQGYDSLGDCRLGIDQKDLRECLSSIQNQGCNNPIDSLERMAACRAGDLCVD